MSCVCGFSYTEAIKEIKDKIKKGQHCLLDAEAEPGDAVVGVYDNSMIS